MKTYDVVVVGGGWAGCSAALTAAIQGASVILCERTDMLLGAGLSGGIMRNNGRWTAAEEMLAMGGGGGRLLALCDEHARHRNITFPGHQNASLYDPITLEPAVKRFINSLGVTVRLCERIVDVTRKADYVTELTTHQNERIRAKAVVDATGSAGPMGNCLRHGGGCALCLYRCPAFGPRVSIAGRCGIPELAAAKSTGRLGALSGSCKLHRDSLHPDLARQLRQEGVVKLKLEPALASMSKLQRKACQQYALDDFASHLILLDTGDAKLMSPYFELESLRSIAGLENAFFTDPKAGGKSNSVRFMSMVAHDYTLRVSGLINLFCAGEKAGVLVGHTEAMVTGTLAGYNASLHASEKEATTIPRTLATGDYVAYTTEQFGTPYGQRESFTFAGSVFFRRMLEKGLYTTDKRAIRTRVMAAEAMKIFG